MRRYDLVALALAWTLVLPGPATAAHGEEVRQCPPVASLSAADQSVAALTRMAHCAAAAGQEALAFLLLRRASSLQLDDRDLVEQAVALRARAVDPDLPDGDLFGARASRGYWLAIAAGQDSNINGGSDAREVTLPLLGNRRVLLNELLIAHRSAVVETNLGATVNYPVSPLLSLHANAMGSLRYNAAEAAYLPHSYRAGIGIEASPTWGRIGVGMASTQRWLARFHVVDERSLTAHADYRVAPGLLAGAAMTRADRRFPYFDDYRARRDGVELSLSHFSSGLRLSLSTSRQRGERQRSELDSRGDSFAIDWTRQLTPSYRLRISWQETRESYDRRSILFVTRRHDTTLLQSLEIEHDLGSRWFLTPRFLREQTRSNLVLAKMQRQQWLVELRREF